MLVVDADAEEVAGVHETDDLTPSVRQQLTVLKAAARQSEHAGRWVALPKQHLPNAKSQCGSELLELGEILAVENPANCVAASFASLTGVSRRQRRQKASSRFEHVHALSSRLPMEIK